MQNSINFKAKFVDKTIIKRNNRQHLVSVVELDKNSIEDKNLLNKLNIEWYSDNSMIKDIKNNFFAKNCNKRKHFYAITIEHQDFEKLNTKNILSLMQVDTMDKDEPLFIEYFLTNPKYAYPKRGTYTEIGKGFLNTIKNLYKKKGIYLYAIKSAYEFYLNNGFTFFNKHTDIDDHIAKMSFNNKSQFPASLKLKKIFSLKLFI